MGNESNEEWRPIGTDGVYEISSMGRVRRVLPGKGTWAGRIVGTGKTMKGYHVATLGGGVKYVHRLVAEAFIPNPCDLPQVNHIDSNKCNNAASNLEWCTNADNRLHSVSNRTHAHGERQGFAKLTEIDVMFIRFWDRAGYTQKEVAEAFGVRRSAISKVALRTTWRHVA